MASWMDEPPKPEELKASSWMDAPPSKEELQGFLSLEPKHSKTETGLMHGLQNATGGFLDEISGAGEVLGRVAGIKGLGGSFSDVGVAESGPTLKMDVLKRAYEEARNKKRALLDAQAKENPKSAMLGSLVGTVASPINKLGAGVSLAKGGAAIGGINALGASDADNARDLLVDTAFGTALGGGVGKVADVAAPVVKAGADKMSGGFRNLAERFGVRALGADKGAVKSMGMNRLKKAAGQMLDEDGFSPLASTDDLLASNAAAKEKGGQMIGEVIGAIDDAGASTFNPMQVASNMDDQLGGFWRSPLNRGETNQFENTLEAIMMRGEKNIPLREAQVLKSELGSVAFPKGKRPIDPSPKQQMALDAYDLVSKEIDRAVDAGAAAINRAGLSDVLKQGKSLYSNASTTEKLLGNKLAKEQGNSFFNLTDTIAGAGAAGYGATTGDWSTAGAAMAAKKGLQKYGAQNAAIGLNKVSKFLLQTPKFQQLMQKNPQAFNALANKMSERLGVKDAYKAAANPQPSVNEYVSEDEAKQKFLEGN